MLAQSHKLWVTMEFQSLQALRRAHPAWRLLASDHAPMVAAFLHRSFIAPNVRTLPEQELTAKLEDYLFYLRAQLGDGAYPKAAHEYLTAWAGDDRGWLRKYYSAQSDEPHYDLTPATEKAIQWLASLEQQRFVGAESRLMLVFDLLRQIVQGSETDPEARIHELERKRNAINSEIEQIRAGRMSFMDPTQLRERFLQAAGTARGLLADFRQVEQNFRELDRQVREQVATWEGGKGEVLEAIFGDRDAIADSDQGRTFGAFWDFLMSPARQEELTELMERVLELDSVAKLEPDRRLKRIHYDWLEAGEVTQRTVARLSEQLRRYLDDQAWLENRRIMGLLREIEQHALAVRGAPPAEPVMELDEPAPRIELAMERPLHSPPVKPRIEQQILVEGESDVEADALFEQAYVDRERLRGRIRQALQTRDQISLAQLIEAHPLEQGLAELVTYLSLASESERAVIDDDHPQRVSWTDATGCVRCANIPRVLFSR
jgi:flagellar motility protein MotE (MotC chaperone)